MDKGNTARILKPFVKGMTDAGADVEILYPKKMKIRPCIGDFQCWYKKVGVCIHTDDMNEALDKMRKSHILVFATPIYLPLPGAFQNFLNRMMPVIEPILRFEDGRTRAKFHDDMQVSKIVLITSGDWWEKENSDVVKFIFKEIARNSGVELVSHLIRPHASHMKSNIEKAALVTEAAEKAGFMLIGKGTISQELLNQVSQPLISEEDIRKRDNAAYRRSRDAIQ